MSVITHDRLKRFNEIQGTVAGNAHDEIAAAQEDQDLLRRDENDQGDEEENKDAVGALVINQETGDAKSVAGSTRSKLTSKTYISKLEQQLNAEREARLRLEKEIEEMKKINAEISSKLGLSQPSA